MLRLVRALVALVVLAAPVQAATPEQRALLLGGASGAFPGAVVDLNFATGQYFTRGATGPLTNTRASAETCFDSAGNLHQAASGQNCVTNLGVGSWEARTNSIRNNTMQGVVAGSPGTLPTNWFIGFNGNGLSSSVIGSGVQNGINYVDVNINGTAVNTNQIFIGLDAAAFATASYGQTWSLSSYFAFVGGVTTNLTSVGLNLNEREGGSGGSGTFALNAPVGSLPTSVSGSPYTLSGTFTDPSSTSAWGTAVINLSSTGVFNFTLRIGVPQLELNSNIPASVASAVVAAGGTCTPGTYTFTVSGGTGTAATISGTVTGTTLSGALTVVTAGSYSALAPSPATLTGGTCATQPTVTLTPTNNGSLAFATPPILTSGSSVTRAADNITLSLASISAPYSLYSVGVPAAPLLYPANQAPSELTDGTETNRCFMFRQLSAGAVAARFTVAGSNVYTQTTVPTWPQNVAGKSSLYCQNGLQLASYNNSPLTSGAGAGSPIMSVLRIGSQTGITSLFNGYISRVALSIASLNSK